MGADYEEDLDAHYKTPMGAGAGASYGWGDTRIHASVEWIGEVSRYAVLEPDPFTISAPSGDSTVTLVIDDELDSVTNWGIGIEHRFNEKWGGYGSYRSDYSARPQANRPSASLTHWDLNHITIGTTLKVGRSDFALGLTGAFAKQPTLRVPEQPAGTTPLQSLETNVTFVTVVVGWKIAF
jgi:long-subunit fatty acid transport protein